MEKCYDNRDNACVVGNRNKSPLLSTDSFLKQMAKKQDSVLSGSTLSAYKVL